jgi:hypothetical protein
MLTRLAFSINGGPVNDLTLMSGAFHLTSETAPGNPDIETRDGNRVKAAGRFAAC